MDIYSQSRLVPHNQKSYQFTPNKLIISRSLTVSGNPGPKRLMLSSRVSGRLNQPDDQESVYNSSRRFNTSQLGRIGLLIDIYA
jgi:hypothetical protein